MQIHLNINSEYYTLYDGKSPLEIHQKYDKNQKSWSLNLFDTGKQRQLKINPFEDTCIGVYVDSDSGYVISMTEIRKHPVINLKNYPFL